MKIKGVDLAVYAFFFCAGLAVAWAATGRAAPAETVKPAWDETVVPLVGIDHIPFAVRDLEGAAATYRQLGFAIKPGRFHADGIRNQHVKFPDGAGLELITVGAPTDELAKHYFEWAAKTEGPAYVGFRTANLQAVLEKLGKLGVSSASTDGTTELRDPTFNWMFVFEGNNRSPTDRPEHFAHSNTAYATAGIWVAPDDPERVVQLFKAPGAHVRQVQTEGSTRLLLPPGDTHGVWIEFRQM